MSCGSEFDTSNCVCDTLLAIVEAQDRVEPGCTSSCSRAIEDLLGGVSPGTFNSVPILLTCKSSCLPYVGVGAVRATGAGAVGTVFVASSIFRVVDVDPETCCGTLELVTSAPLAGTSPFLVTSAYPDAGDLLTAATNVPLGRTGVCITVDLNCYCSVSCLPAQTLQSVTVPLPTPVLPTVAPTIPPTTLVF